MKCVHAIQQLTWDDWLQQAISLMLVRSLHLQALDFESMNAELLDTGTKLHACIGHKQI